MIMNKNVVLVMMYASGMRFDQEELGLGYIAAVLRAAGYTVTVVAERSMDKALDKIKDIAPFLIGFTIYDANRIVVYQLAANIRKRFPDVVMFGGGIYPSYAGERMLNECEHIDYAIYGEGEQTSVNLANCCIEKTDPGNVRGIIYRKNNQIVKNPKQPAIENLDQLPHPARDILIQNNLKVAQMSTSRGCNASCGFCASQIIFPKWRGRSVESIMDELEYLITHYQIKAVNFIDASFEDGDRNVQKLMKLSQEIIRKKLNILFYIQLRAEFHRHVTQELIDSLKQAGLCSACVGIESGNAADLKLYNKIATVDDNEKIVTFLRKNQINVEPGFINFNPYSTFEGLKSNIDYLEKHMFACNIEYLAISCCLYKGTSLYKKTCGDGLIDPTRKAGYRFLDQRIENLYEYVSGYIKDNPDTEIVDLCKMADMYATRMISVLMGYEHIFTKERLFTELSVYQKYKEQHLEICKRLNQTIAEWFRELLLLAQANWDISAADKITYRYISKETLIEFVKLFSKCKKKFLKEILSINVKNAGILLEFMIS